MARKISKGADPSTPTGAGIFWKPAVNSDQAVKILVAAEEILSGNQFSDWDLNPAPIWMEVEDDPGHRIGLKPGYRAYVPISVEIEGSKVVRFWSLPKQLHTQLHEFSNELDGLEGLIIKVKRSGQGIETRYTLIPTGKRESVTEEVPGDETILPLLGPEDTDGVWALLQNSLGVDTPEEVLAYYRTGNSTNTEEI